MSAQTAPYHQPATLEEVRTLWIGDLPYWADENYLRAWFSHTGEVLSIKVIRNKITGQPEGYGFVEFTSHQVAESILQSYNGTQIPGTELTFRLNWASSGIGERRTDGGPEHSIFVGDLAPDVTDYLLQETFRVSYPSVRGAKVVTDPNTGRSKGYGFVKFADEAERNRAMVEMNGLYCSTRPMRISAAAPKKTATGVQLQYAATKAVYPAPAYTTPVQAVPVDNDINNTTVFIGNLDPNVTEEELRQIFLQFGDIVYVKIPAAKGCGFVQFATRTSAEESIQRMQGTVIGQQVVRLSWGRSPTAKQDVAGVWGHTDPNQLSAYYAYGQGYDAYAYGVTQDPSAYAYGAYAGYGQYPHQTEGAPDMTALSGVAQPVEHTEELYDPLATPDVDKLNGAYLAVHGRAILGRPLWQTTSLLPQQT
ncbi:polyadenylate-binding protein RBP47B'-like isoform X1 [Salvia miltiorrhiza]|uniref:polyadenylate-binding protein RBP47B'-like isoform X1 n=1 Tax=Salvia miltiorrhiza TaxID=226208 RepID=UPI0025ACE23B|nr:polyadenylate-binding protein RBP47B'-like isoform X1 [Salvia miltiorrhiza]